MRGGPVQVVSVQLRKHSGRGAGPGWSAVVGPEILWLLDQQGEVCAELSALQAAAAVELVDSLDSAPRLLLLHEGQRHRFDIEGAGVEHVADFLRRGMVEAGPAAWGRLLWRGWRDLALGLCLLAGGTIATVLSITSGRSTQFIFYGVLLAGIIVLYRSGQQFVEYRRLKRESLLPPPPPPRGEAIEIVEAAALPPRPPTASLRRLGRLMLILVVLVIGAAILSVVVIHFISGPPSVRRRGPAVAAPSPPPAAAPAPSVDAAAERGATTAAAPAELSAARESRPQLGGACAWASGVHAVTHGRLVSQSQIRVIAERAGICLRKPLQCDAVDPGQFTGSFAGASGGVIPSGSRVNSYLLHINGDGASVLTLKGTITFSEPVLGIIASNAALDASDSIAGLPTIEYPTGGRWRQFFDSDAEDFIILEPDRRTVTIYTHTGRWVDQLRIITAAAP